MTLSEFKKKIANAKEVEWFKSKSERFDFDHINFSIEIKGVSAIYEFANQQANGWGEISDTLPDSFERSKLYFNDILERMVYFIDNYSHLEEDDLERGWRNLWSYLSSDNNYFTYNSPETAFLMDIHKNIEVSFDGAHDFLIGEMDSNFNDKDYFIGALLAYEFSQKGNSDISKRKKYGKTAIGKAISDFEKYISESESMLIDHLSGSEKKYKQYVEVIDQLKIDKEALFTEWFDESKSGFNEFDQVSKQKIQDLESTYKEKLKLEEPAMYWAKRALKLKSQGWISVLILVILVFIVAYTLGELLWKTPEQIYISFFDGDKSAAIRWSIIYLTFISFIAYCIRAITRVMFSSFHLARDCEERYTLTYFYLSLLKDSSVNEKDRQLIMQSLFSRADTGLLKDDSTPAMPNDLTGKLFGK